MDGMGAVRPTVHRAVPNRMADRLIVPLDVRTVREAHDLIDRLDGTVSFFKIGLWLLFAEGTDKLIDELVRRGKNVFLDYKMFDIGETVKQGVSRARDRGVRFITVHGDDDIMRSAVEGKGDDDRLKILSITVLTSLDDKALHEMGYRLTVKELIELRVAKSLECGCDGIIASALDNPDQIRQKFNSLDLLIVTPGVRRLGAPTHDHKRSVTPGEAIAAGADYIVMGRTIIDAADPAIAAREVIADMEGREKA